MQFGVIGLKYRGPVPCDHTPSKPAVAKQRSSPGSPAPPGWQNAWDKRPKWRSSQQPQATTPAVGGGGRSPPSSNWASSYWSGFQWEMWGNWGQVRRRPTAASCLALACMLSPDAL